MKTLKEIKAFGIKHPFILSSFMFITFPVTILLVMMLLMMAIYAPFYFLF